ncbi:MAG TPA: sulfotransferase domain-containing protein [Phenylobacterium sp.]|jgi:hypothetical protein|nr:sulfotransferase domain-containing protein [Phenylobacterium sp.]
MLNRPFPTAKIIHIVRDPRDVAVSSMGHNHRAGFREAVHPGATQNRQVIEKAVESWLEAVAAVDDFAQAQPELVLELRLRDLHADPIGESRKLFSFLGAATDEVVLEQIAAATSFESLAGRPPGVEDLSSFLRKGVVGDWEQRLDEDAAGYIAENCGAWMERTQLAA